MRTRLLPFALVCSLLVSACGTDPEYDLLVRYLEDAEEVGTGLSDVGTKFETLINVQANMLAWTTAEKAELQAVSDTLDALIARAEGMEPPVILEDVHPILLQAMEEMKISIDGVMTVALQPETATDQMAEDIEAHATTGQELGDEYVAKMEAAIAAEYPDMME